MKKVLLFFFLILLVSCSYRYQPPPVIKDPGYPRMILPSTEKTVVVESEKVYVEDMAGIYPDPTNGFLENGTSNVFLEIWINPVFRDKKPKGPPIIELPPKGVVKVAMPLGKHIVYAQGMIQTQYGWKKIGQTSKSITVGRRINWKTVFRQSNFRLYR